jgi:hypothetical protein
VTTLGRNRLPGVERQSCARALVGNPPATGRNLCVEVQRAAPARLTGTQPERMPPDMGAWETAPSTPIGDCRDWFLRLRCGCGPRRELHGGVGYGDRSLLCVLRDTGVRDRLAAWAAHPPSGDAEPGSDPLPARGPDGGIRRRLHGRHHPEDQRLRERRSSPARLGAVSAQCG